MKLIESARAAVARSRRTLDRSVERALDAELNRGIKPRRGGIVERLLEPERREMRGIRRKAG